MILIYHGNFILKFSRVQKYQCFFSFAIQSLSMFWAHFYSISTHLKHPQHPTWKSWHPEEQDQARVCSWNSILGNPFVTSSFPAGECHCACCRPWPGTETHLTHSMTLELYMFLGFASFAWADGIIFWSLFWGASSDWKINVYKSTNQ